eukprot:3504072-Rhodomonas_salina.1
MRNGGKASEGEGEAERRDRRSECDIDGAAVIQLEAHTPRIVTRLRARTNQPALSRQSLPASADPTARSPRLQIAFAPAKPPIPLPCHEDQPSNQSTDTINPSRQLPAS